MTSFVLRHLTHWSVVILVDCSILWQNITSGDQWPMLHMCKDIPFWEQELNNLSNQIILLLRLTGRINKHLLYKNLSPLWLGVCRLSALAVILLYFFYLYFVFYHLYYYINYNFFAFCMWCVFTYHTECIYWVLLNICIFYWFQCCEKLYAFLYAECSYFL